ncbi:MAG: saccharopine dehydrogenase C-terminal domain-containing protein [candidate division WOR-3 bacterium]
MIFVFGAGRQGIVTIETLRDLRIEDVVVVEMDRQNAEKASKFGFKTIVNSFDSKDVEDLIQPGDIIINCLPARFGESVLHLAINKRTDLVDISYMEEDPFEITSIVSDRGLRFVVDAGFAPGLSNFLVGLGYEKYGNDIDRIVIKVGGIPLNPVPPFNYHLTWSPEDLLDEYRRPARIKINGVIQSVPALSGIQKEFFKGIEGEFESFYTDGLRTLLRTIEGVPTLEERTVRYPGHGEIFNVLKQIGLLDKECPIYMIFVNWLLDQLKKGDERDLAILRVEFWKGNIVRGFEIVHPYNHKKGRTAMSELTGIPPAIITKFLREGEIFQTGILPLELLGMQQAFSEKFIRLLEDFDIHFKEF